MPEIRDIVKLGIDAYHGTVEKYSVAQSMDTLRQALIEANGGSTVLNYRNIRDGKCAGLFAIVEEILNKTVVEGFTSNRLFETLVDYRNLAEGDENVFATEDSQLFVVSEVANGTQAIRRQRLVGQNDVVIPTSMKMVRIYEELNRVLAGRVDFNHLIDVVAKSFENKILADINKVWSNATSADIGGSTYYPAAGSYNEDTLLDIIAHVEAAAGGRTAVIIGTKKACRMLAASIQSDGAKEDLYNLGYYGKFYGTPVFAVAQMHEPGTSNFLLDDKTLTIIAGDEKPIKFVYEGDPIIIPGDPTANADLTQEYLYGCKYGLGIVLAGGNAGVGIYETV